MIEILFTLAVSALSTNAGQGSAEDSTGDVDTSQAYLLVSAEVTPNRLSQPSSIAITRLHTPDGKVIHLEMSALLHTVPAGIYRLHHFDLPKQRWVRFNQSVAKRKLDVDLRPGVINIIGHFKLRRKAAGHDIAWEHSANLIARACELYPDVFGALPVQLLDEDKRTNPMQLDCSDASIHLQGVHSASTTDPEVAQPPAGVGDPAEPSAASDNSEDLQF